MEQTLRTALTQERVQRWTTTLEQDLQLQVKEAANIRQSIATAKTATKRQYFERKFKKVQSNVMSTLATLQRIREMSPKQENKGDGNDDAEQPIT